MAAAALAAMMLSALPALAQDADSGWRQTFFLYGMGAAIDGDAQIGPLVVPVDVSISDLFSALDMGGMAAYRADNGTWSFTGDLTYMNLGWDKATDQGRAGVGLDVKQLTVMGTVGRRVTPRLEAFPGFSGSVRRIKPNWRTWFSRLVSE